MLIIFLPRFSPWCHHGGTLRDRDCVDHRLSDLFSTILSESEVESNRSVNIFLNSKWIGRENLHGDCDGFTSPIVSLYETTLLRVRVLAETGIGCSADAARIHFPLV